MLQLFPDRVDQRLDDGARAFRLLRRGRACSSPAVSRILSALRCTSCRSHAIATVRRNAISSPGVVMSTLCSVHARCQSSPSTSMAASSIGSVGTYINTKPGESRQYRE